MAFVDGENLTNRFETLQSEKAWTPRVGSGAGGHLWTVQHRQGLFVWSPLTIINVARREELLRVHYYTTYAADESDCDNLSETISSLKSHRAVEEYHSPGAQYMMTSEVVNLIPRVFRKQKRSTKTKSVDINLCVDVMDYVRQNALDSVFLVTGDVDYLPLIEAVMRAGKHVYVAALSSGLSPRIRTTADSFLLLDGIYFNDHGYF